MALLLGAFVPATLFAGDEDPFPLACVNFSGNWKSDEGDRYSITQRHCSFLKVQMGTGSQSTVMNIIPDNKTRSDKGSQVRHRWNSPDNATALETHRVFMESSSVRVTVVTMFEQANSDMILQTTYTTVECLGTPGAQPRHLYDQTIFRRQ